MPNGTDTSFLKMWGDWGDVAHSIVRELSRVLKEIDPSLDFVPLSTQDRRYAVVGRDGSALNAQPDSQTQPIRLEEQAGIRKPVHLKVSVLPKAEAGSWRQRVAVAGFEMRTRTTRAHTDRVTFNVGNANEVVKHEQLFNELFQACI